MNALSSIRQSLVAMFTGDEPEGETGASLVEYVLLILGIALVVIVVVRTLGGTIRDLFDDTNTELNQQPNQQPGT